MPEHNIAVVEAENLSSQYDKRYVVIDKDTGQNKLCLAKSIVLYPPEAAKFRLLFYPGGDFVNYRNFAIRIDEETYLWLQQQAQAQQRSIGNFIKRVLSLYKQSQDKNTE